MSLPSTMFQYRREWADNMIVRSFTPFSVNTVRHEDNYFKTRCLEEDNSNFKQSKDEGMNSFDFADPYLNKRSFHENSYINNERVYYLETDCSFKSVVPYSHYSKSKKLFYTPFSSNHDDSLVTKISQHSFYLMKEVPRYEYGCRVEERVYQVQLDRDKIDRLREQIDITFECLLKLVFCNKIRVESSVEIARLRRSLRTIMTQIESERKFVYDTQGKEILLSSALHNEVYENYQHILDPVIQDECIPVLLRLQKELFQMGYLDEQHIKLKESLEFICHDINQTITVLARLKKKIESANCLSSFSEKDLKIIDKIKKPHQLYSYFLDIAIKMKILLNESRTPSRLKYTLQKYLKTIVILELYKNNQNDLKIWKRKLSILYKQLQKRMNNCKSDVKELMKKRQAGLSESDISIESLKIDPKKIIDEELIDSHTISDIKDQLINIEVYTSRIQKIYQNVCRERDDRKVYKIYSETASYLEQVDQLIQGLAYAREEYDKIKEKIKKEEFEEKTAEVLEKEAALELEHISSQVKGSYCAFNSECWNYSQLTDSLNLVITKFLKKKKKDKELEKTIPFGQKKIMEKLAQIIRERKKQRNKMLMSSKARVESFLNICDIAELFKSKKLWQAIISEEAHLVSIKGYVQDECKSVNHKIYCNPELEIYLVKIIKYFVNSLSDSIFVKS